VTAWCIDVADFAPAAEQYFQWLDAPERERALRYRQDADRRRFIAARLALRFLAGRAIGVAPDAVVFTYTTEGKPEILEGTRQSNWQVSVSHSGNRAYVALALGRRIGIDVERVAESTNELAELTRFFVPHEREAIAKLTEPDASYAFYRCWTRKEAFLKAIGLGLPGGLHRFSVSVTDEARLLSLDPSLGPASSWQLHAFDEVCGGSMLYSVTLAVECAPHDDVVLRSLRAGDLTKEYPSMRSTHCESRRSIR
jgi:4'-phosphopantetheinyl transferase